MRTMIAAVTVALLSVGCDRSLPPSPSAPAPVTAPAPPPTDPGPPEPSLGRYSLEMRLDEGCEQLPSQTRSRTYDAEITASAKGGFVVTLSGGRFLSGGICTAAPSGLGCNQFMATRQGDEMRFELRNENDDGHGGHIVEQTPEGWWIEVIGAATGRLQSDTIVATGAADVWYCETPLGYPFPCPTYGGCSSANFQLSFTRK
jgi:hypothetical protein